MDNSKIHFAADGPSLLNWSLTVLLTKLYGYQNHDDFQFFYRCKARNEALANKTAFYAEQIKFSQSAVMAQTVADINIKLGFASDSSTYNKPLNLEDILVIYNLCRYALAWHSNVRPQSEPHCYWCSAFNDQQLQVCKKMEPYSFEQFLKSHF